MVQHAHADKSVRLRVWDKPPFGQKGLLCRLRTLRGLRLRPLLPAKYGDPPLLCAMWCKTGNACS